MTTPTKVVEFPQNRALVIDYRGKRSVIVPASANFGPAWDDGGSAEPRTGVSTGP